MFSNVDPNMTVNVFADHITYKSGLNKCFGSSAVKNPCNLLPLYQKFGFFGGSSGTN